ncbi:MAG: hypothetical protein FWF29_02175 [Treponema sp.]|nr:hypothetical protein [Treponema sp.]
MDEKKYLRELAKKQMEIAALPIMGQRLKKWCALNNGERDTPMVSVEFNGPPEEVFPQLKCETQLGREVETQITRHIRNHELLADDRVIPACVSVSIPNWITPFGIDFEYTYALKADGKPSMGYTIKHVIDDLQEDFGKLKKTLFYADAGLCKAKEKQAQIEELLGGVIPVQIQFPSFYFDLGGIAFRLMGMEKMMMALYEYPELMHEMMNTVTEDMLRYMDEIESSGAIVYNNNSSWLGQGSWGYTTDLPRPGAGKAISFADVWGYTNFQETIGISPQMFNEFYFSYMEKITKRFGLLSYGCCEPVDHLWDLCLSRLTNLRKISVSPWSNEEALAEKIRGKKIVYHRKPRATFIAADTVFNEEALAEHIAKSVKAAAGCPLEVTFREELTVLGEPWRLTRAVQITREQFAKYYKP